MSLEYLTGFNNHFSSEALANTLPEGQNSPQKVAHGLYAEQLSGSAFTAPRQSNHRSWLYRIQPSVVHNEFKEISNAYLRSAPFNEVKVSPNQLRWNPLTTPKEDTDFIQGLITMAGNGCTESQQGAAIHHYYVNTSMKDRYFYNADGDFLIVAQQGELLFHTEFGILALAPGEIAVIQRGIKFQVNLANANSEARGYICEVYGAPFNLPELGPIGANGLANPRDFQTPVAAYEQRQGDFELICKFQGQLYNTTIDHSPLNVVAWHGNYAPYKYNLKHFNTMNSVSFDHADPSIFTVLTSPSGAPGVANVDFVIFPPRWMVAEHTFRPPYFHRNIMSEYMGLIQGEYDAKSTGFIPGGASLHNCMSAHGPDAATFNAASETTLKPQYYQDTLAFMFESNRVWKPTAFALNTPARQTDYQSCWQKLTVQFTK